MAVISENDGIRDFSWTIVADYSWSTVNNCTVGTRSSRSLGANDLLSGAARRRLHTDTVIGKPKMLTRVRSN